MALKSLEFVVKGTVHGVGFRQFVRDIARADGLVGWVKNDPVCLVLLSKDMTLSYIRRGMLLE
jgi:acylphosphatase